ncbi:MAG: sugar translocase [Lachnospiraceae bacterium]|jgi:O-antigen/teichoic acid export membrane protein|nr:sugar translocase [Lachnospiraceae bacterium]
MLNKNSRTKNVKMNMLVGLVCQCLTLGVNFIVRTVYIMTLGKAYLGVNGLFSNILSVLSFAELGIGNALVYSMYKPLAVGDTKKIGSLVDLYRTVYKYIAIVISCCGLLVIPFLGYIIHETPDIPESIVLLYVLVLFNTIMSYVLTYKKSIIIADQKNYIVLLINEIVKIIQKSIQIFFLVTTHNYITYLILEILGTVLINIISSCVANRMYPFIKEEHTKLSSDEKREIFVNVKSLAAYKFGNVILDGTDSILVSVLDSIKTVGTLSNYVLINSSVNALMKKINDSFTASVGNLNAISEENKQKKVFDEMMFISAWLYGLVSIMLLILTKKLIPIWIGEEYLLDNMSHSAIVFAFYLENMNFACSTYRNTLGLFRYGRLAPIIAAFLNIILSVILYYYIGLPGIFIATPISRFLTIGIVDPYLVYSRCFKQKPYEYFFKLVSYTIINIIIYFICNNLVGCWNISGIIGLIMYAFIIFAIYNSFMLGLFWHTNVFKGVLKRVIKQKV